VTSLLLAQGEHYYLSTACLHGKHDYCVAAIVTDENFVALSTEETVSFATVGRRKKPSECKFCDAKCICPCHRPAERQPDITSSLTDLT